MEPSKDNNSILVEPVDGGSFPIHFGTIVTSYLDSATISIKVRNKGKHPIPLSFQLSEAISGRLRIHSVHQRHGQADENPDATDVQLEDTFHTDMSNLNFLHTEQYAQPLNKYSQFIAQNQTDPTIYIIGLNAWPRIINIDDRDSDEGSLQKSLCEGSIVINHSTSSEFLSSVRIHGYISSSVIKVDKDILDFGRCPVGVWSAFISLTIRNLSEIATYICFSGDFPIKGSSVEQKQLCILASTPAKSFSETASAPSSLNIKDRENPSSNSSQNKEQYPINDTNRILIPSLSSINFSIGIRCLIPDDNFNEQLDNWLSIQNERNPSNTSYIRIMVNSSVEQIADKLYISCGNEINFNNCYINCYTFRDILLKNNYPEVITTALLCDDRQQHQILFELLQDGEEDDSPFFVGDDMGLLKSNRSRNRNRNKIGQRGQQTDLNRTPKQPTKSRLTERITLRPAQYCRVRIWYNPSRKTFQSNNTTTKTTGLASSSTPKTNQTTNIPEYNEEDEERRGSLEPRKFQLIFQMPTGETRRVTLNSHVCESIIKLTNTSENLGDCDVLTTYTSKVTVLNCCDLPTNVKISYISQCVSTNIHEFMIKAHDTFTLPLTFIPRQVNPSYHKEITFINLNNNKKSKDKDTSIVFTLYANCIDKQGISLHTSFYKILVPPSDVAINEIDFGITISNHMTLRCFVIENKSTEKLLLKLSGYGNHQSGIDVYIPDVSLPVNTWVQKRLLKNENNDQNDQFNGNDDDSDSNYNISRLPPLSTLPPRLDQKEDYESLSNNENDFNSLFVGIRRGQRGSTRPYTTKSYRTAVSLLDPGVGKDYLPEKSIASHDRIDVVGRACDWGYSLEMQRRDESSTYLNIADENDDIDSNNSLNNVNSEMINYTMSNNDYNNTDKLDEFYYDYDTDERIMLSSGEKSLSGEENWNELIRILQEEDRDNGLLELMPTDHSGHEEEMKYMEHQLSPITRFHNAIRDGYLHKNDIISIPGNKQSIVLVSLTLNDNDVRQSIKLRSIEKKLIIEMLEYNDNNLMLTSGKYDSTATNNKKSHRELILTVRACKSLMSVSPLSQMNFGIIPNDEHKHKQFSIVNLCQAPLLYEIIIDGPIDDHNELRLYESQGYNGVVRPYGTKDIRFIYAPSIPGTFQHRFLVENILDRWASSQLIVKATVIPNPSGK